MANNFISFDIGPYNIQFNAERYDLKRKDDYSVIAKAIGSSDQTATISIWVNDGLTCTKLSTDDRDAVLRDTNMMARSAETSLPSSSTAAVPSATRINGHDGSYVRINYGIPPEKTFSCERVFCSLDDGGYILNILSIYHVTDKEERTLVGDIVSSIYNIRIVRQ